MISRILSWLAFGLLATYCLAIPCSAAQPPNIVFILCDDLGIGDLKPFNPGSQIPTPNIDRLAAAGMRFSDAHSGSAVCTPTRYGIMCGRYAWRTRLQSGVLGGLSPSLVGAQQWTVPKLLKQRNYHSACIGKWHLGLDWQRPEGKSVSENSIETADQNRNVDYDQPFAGGPLAAGFDEYFGISGSLDMLPYTFLKNNRVLEAPSAEKAFGMKHAEDKNTTRLGPAAPSFTAEDVLPRFTQEAINYLESRASDPSKRPFFLYLPFASPHTPIAPSAEWQGKSGLNSYADFVMQQDAAIGKVLEALDRLQLAENTVVFFTSDNGCSPQADLPALRAKGHDPCWPFRGHKADIFEGGHRVPLIVRWPGMVGQGLHAQQTVCLNDFLATAAAIADIDAPQDAGPDSFSLLSILQNEQAEALRGSTVHHSINGSFALRRGNYKLCFCDDSGGWSEPRPGKSNSEAGLQLFDLSTDLGETTNIAAQHPELVLNLSREMEQIIARGRSTSGQSLKNDVDVDLWKRSRRPASLDEPALSNFVSPKPWQVLQRRHHVPQFSNDHHPGGPARGWADVPIEVQSKQPAVTSVKYRLSHQNATGTNTNSWTKATIEGGSLKWSMRVPAGGWYAIEVRLMNGDKIAEQLTSEPFGVGEVFVVAGQSYATNTNEQLLKVRDPYQRVVAYQLQSQAWRVAHDPQPVVDNSQFGSIWPAVGDQLVAALDVPIAFANVAYGGTSSTQWQPGGDLHKQLVTVGQQLGDFRGVLWQQGESDVIEHATTAAYVERVVKIREAAQSQWNLQRPWFLAKSTLHPTVYRRPDAEARIRTAMDQLVSQYGFSNGPDTDMLADANRGPTGSKRHFSASGQQHAASMWFATLISYVQQPRPTFEASIEKLPQMQLRQLAWSSEVVHRESSVLIQAEPDSPIEARLAFPAQEILSVTTTDGSKNFQIDRDFKLSDDRLKLVWISTPGVEPITTAQMFPPKDSPNSYRHRARNPEQNMFYAPGSYFHLHNLEITYRRSGSVEAANTLEGALPKTLEKLRAKQPVRIAVSGDSISTGLDASGTTFTPPNQPGYPELVAAQLASDFGSEIHLTNRAVSGWSVANGVADLDKLLESQPDLLIVAYGMNDVGRKDPKWFVEQSQLIDQRAREKFPNIEIIWVAPMLGHSEWVHTPREMFDQYRDQLKTLVGPTSRLADLTSVWTRLLQHKHDYDLTGNGLNHPNDFGHRLYAQAILELLPVTQ